MGGVAPIPMYVLQAEKRIKPVNVPPASKGDNVVIGLPLEADLEMLGNGLYMSGRLNNRGQSENGFSCR